MFDFVNQFFIFLLEAIYQLVGSYGLAIILITVAFRLLLWPVSKSQMESMARMQELQPKMKTIQDRYKGDPQKLQEEMMKLYKDHKFNPMGGCLPLLIQLPLFIGLYGAISSPHFMMAQDPIFLDFIHLKRTGIISHGGVSFDDGMNLAEGNGTLFGIGKDKLVADNKMSLTLKTGNTVERNVPDVNKSLTFKPKENFLPGVPVKVSTTFKDLDLEGYEGNIEKIQLNVLNTATKEMETITLLPLASGQGLGAELPTKEGKTALHLDILLLVILFGVTMIGSQKMMQTNPNAQTNAQQQQMMKIMPVMFTGLLVVFPIPAGVLLYMVVNGLFQMIQSLIFQKGGIGNLVKQAPSEQVVEIKPDSSK